MAYSATIREAALHKLCAPHKPSLSSVAREFGVGEKALRSWRDKRRQSLGGETLKRKRQQDWTLEERFQAVVETAHMDDEELGAFCRQHGLHSNTLALWRETCVNVIRKSSEDETEKEELKKQLKSVKRDLKRKDKALAEAAARLVLQKKAKALWGEAEDEDEDDI